MKKSTLVRVQQIVCLNILFDLIERLELELLLHGIYTGWLSDSSGNVYLDSTGEYILVEHDGLLYSFKS
ncbi:MAG: hypothetical protein PHT37_06325 [Candidatus Cloacimonetes bacterium]|jgi:hypothetical protein|nr:hypothetical protein [Candidatus Cloacimonadota bacterium]MDY0173162.1 hypothetical protein [Candidatus Cloacimonadaceae bacterium]MCB5272099.1 hypothetical protein [Candidatus Cloacimonadota bacterium]MDD2423849.1 hypothetical protein [Candidatus Cloacimonadota bacterium]MDD3563646.1 hypothetical protein [Candidatus Cloacimonadota bacterium]